MRSCLIQVLIAVAVVFALLWFGLPFGASWLATNALNGAGFTGTNTRVDVSADLPPRILLGHADRIKLTSSDVSVGGLHAGAIDMQLTDVELFNRTIGQVSGTLTDVRVAAPNGDPVTIAEVAVDGPGSAASVTMKMSRAEAARLAESQLKAQTHLVATVTFQEPDGVTITSGGQSKQGRLIVRTTEAQRAAGLGGDLLLAPVVEGEFPTVTLVKAGGGNPFALSDVTVEADDIKAVGTINLQSILGL